MTEKVEDYIEKAYENLKRGDAGSAKGLLKEALELDFDHDEVRYALKCLNWWLDKLKCLDDFYSPYERGGYILSQWEAYYSFLARIEEGNHDSCQYAIKRFVFSLALGNFLILLKDEINQQDSVLLLQAGRCCKSIGDWEEARRYLEQASRFKREDSTILSELADVNALMGEVRAAKVLFREAFFLDPQLIDFSVMESEMILRLRDRVMEMGYTGSELAEWIPVWGRIWGVFSVKRELKPVELGRLKQSILSLENENRSKSGGDPLVKPRLLNRYFWLMDHCEHNRDTSALADETMLKIKFIDPVIHEHYRT
ncbi:MAG: hypothetical protein LBH42_04200 [Treponema sp.]|jgi:tetratricopeptide (TPR) repeat protein|nr:hypothetical protein [Treponema sp.]